ncbi:MAG: hypothetical protein QMD23_05645 [Candidatus Bathyarchaeia archaeon]|nr:hypothetical protein [Candidatus Bathyarchaeia archaeon]
MRESTKSTIVGICSTWFEYLKIAWKPPKYEAIHEIPFIPTEQELDQLIAASGKKVATFLQLLKETGARRRNNETNLDGHRLSTKSSQN